MQRILVIEDDPKVQRSMSRLFEPEGFTVEIAGDGLAGVEAFSTRPANVVLLDLRMPGMGGKDVCSEIKRRSASRLGRRDFGVNRKRMEELGREFLKRAPGR